MKKITFLFALLLTTLGFSQPTTNAPTPTNAAADVISVYSDAYTNVATNYNPNWGQSGFCCVDPSYNPGTGNLVMAYNNFNYQGTEVATQNASLMEFLHVDVWTSASPASTTLQVSPINNGTGAGEFLVTVPIVQNGWSSINIPKSSFTGMTWNSVFQMKFAANGPGSTVPVTIYVDNVYFWKMPTAAGSDANLSDLKVDGTTIAGFGSGVVNYSFPLPNGTTVIPQITSATTSDAMATTVITQATALPGSATVVVTSQNTMVTKTYTVNYVLTGPATAAPTPPARPTADVISLFSDAYTNIGITEWSTSWDDSSIEDITVSGNATKKINLTNFLGVQIATYQNATDFTHFHMDYYIDAGTDLVGKVVNPKLSNHAAQAGETSALLLTNLPTTTGSWVSLDVPLSTFGGDQARASIYQFLITSNVGTVYVDNIYLHKNTILGTNDFNTSKVKMYPNPTSNVLNIESTSAVELVSISNLLGQVILSKTSNTSLVSVDVSSLQAGVYITNTTIDGNVSSSKFVKK